MKASEAAIGKPRKKESAAAALARTERASKLNFKHGLSYTRFYWVFHGMKARCHNKNHNRYDLYGAKGIKIQWASFEEFTKDMHDGYKEHCEKFGQKNTYIERRDNNKDYCLENCYWATALEQGNNTSRNHRLVFDGRSQTIAQWGSELGIDRFLIKDRIRRGWTPDEALTIPAGTKKLYHQGKHNKSYGRAG